VLRHRHVELERAHALHERVQRIAGDAGGLTDPREQAATANGLELAPDIELVLGRDHRFAQALLQGQTCLGLGERERHGARELAQRDALGGGIQGHGWCAGLDRRRRRGRDVGAGGERHQAKSVQRGTRRRKEFAHHPGPPR
jgi:hypothetical protein